ncbi:MAG TPA: hypothetical protein VK983_05160 [Candidatus Limnocylindrales bacterium]|nr:hypothetical protein [Candidatus Limnocylindrales bacterium]
MPIVTQALVAVGGRATRMTRLHATVKAFEYLGSQSALHLTLIGMKRSGIRQIVLAIDNPGLTEDIKLVATEAGFTEGQISIIHDRELGVTGLPFVAERLLADSFIFDASHSALPAAIYSELIALHQSSSRAVTTGVARVAGNNSRHILSPKELKNCPVVESQTWQGDVHTTVCAALPMVLARRHLMALVASRYNIGNYIESLAQSAELAILLSGWPPEFDTDEELLKVRVLNSISTA